MIFSRPMFIAYLAATARAMKRTSKKKYLTLQSQDDYSRQARLIREAVLRGKTPDFQAKFGMISPSDLEKVFPDHTERDALVKEIISDRGNQCVSKKARNVVSRILDGAKLEAKFQKKAAAVGEKMGFETGPLFNQFWESKSMRQHQRDQDWRPGSEVREIDGEHLRVLQFNILAHGLSGVKSGFGSYSQPSDRSVPPRGKPKSKDKCILELLFANTWSVVGKKKKTYAFPHRFRRIAGLVLKQNPDIISMQELDRFEGMKKILARYGYDGVWYEKEQDGACKGGNNGFCNDGVAIFWNTNRIGKDPLDEMVKVPLPTFKTEVVRDAEGNVIMKKAKKGQKPKPEKVITLDEDNKVVPKPESEWGKQVAMFQKLHFIDSGKEFVVGTGHFKSGKVLKDCAPKRYQMKYFAEQVSQRYSDVPLIFTADLNTSYDSAAFKLFYNGRCDAEKFETEFRRVVTLPEENQEYPADNILESSYSPVRDNREGNPTNRNTAVKLRLSGGQPEKIGVLDDHTIDFIFHSRKHWRTVATLSIPTFGEVNRATGGDAFEKYVPPLREAGQIVEQNGNAFIGELLPNWQYPSDHFAIGADLVLAA